MPLKKVSQLQRLMAAYGLPGTLYFASVWVRRRFQHAILGTPLTWRKFHLIHELAYIHNYRSMLEISTARTGYTYNHIDRSRFDICRRLSYLTPNDWTDGAPVDYRSSNRDISECLHQIRAQGLRFDIVFIDPWHEYECTRRDMQVAFSLVNDDGIIVMHDCAPQSKAAFFAPSRGDLEEWYGVTYKAYLDVLLTRNHLWYCTVDADTGCGMIRSSQKTCLYKRAVDQDPACIRAWHNVGDDYNASLRIYEGKRDSLMNVVTVSEFLAAEWQSRKSMTLSRPFA